MSEELQGVLCTLADDIRETDRRITGLQGFLVQVEEQPGCFSEQERLATRGERSLGADALRREVPHLYYGALWYAARLRLPIIFRGDGRRALLLLLAASADGAAAALAAPGPPEPEVLRVEAADPGADAPPPPPPEAEGGDVAARPPSPGLAASAALESFGTIPPEGILLYIPVF